MTISEVMLLCGSIGGFLLGLICMLIFTQSKYEYYCKDILFQYGQKWEQEILHRGLVFNTKKATLLCWERISSEQVEKINCYFKSTVGEGIFSKDMYFRVEYELPKNYDHNRLSVFWEIDLPEKLIKEKLYKRDKSRFKKFFKDCYVH